MLFTFKITSLLPLEQCCHHQSNAWVFTNHQGTQHCQGGMGVKKILFDFHDLLQKLIKLSSVREVIGLDCSNVIIFLTAWPVNILTVLYICKNQGIWATIMCMYGVTWECSYPSLCPASDVNWFTHSLGFSQKSAGLMSGFQSLSSVYKEEKSHQSFTVK